MFIHERLLEDISTAVDQPDLQQDLVRFCERWDVQELALFGSALRDDFHPESDLDVLITFEKKAEWSLLDHVRMQQELQVLLNRPVDLVSRRGVERSKNKIRQSEILRTAKPLVSKREDVYVA